MNNLKKILLTTILLIFLTTPVFAYQLKIALDECLFSFNEEPETNGQIPFNNWDEQTHSGVFMKINNLNKKLGENQNPIYTYTYYQNNGQPRNYYNNFKYYQDKFSSLPILNIDLNKNNQVYIKCSYVVGDYRVFFTSFRQTYWQEGKLKLTPDFNITKNIFESEPPLSNFDNNIYSILPEGVFGRSDQIYYFDNKYSQGSTYKELYEQGFYPNTKPYVISTFNLNDVPPGLITANPLLREGGHQELINYFYSYIYVNSSHINSPTVFPIFNYGKTSVTIYNDKDEKIIKYYSHTGDCRNNNVCMLLQKDYRVVVNYSFINPYNIELNNLRLSKYFDSVYMWQGGMDQVKEINKIPSIIQNQEQISFSPYQTKNFILDYKINEDYSLPDALHYALFYYDTNARHAREAASRSQVNWNRIGSDCVNYLGFQRYDPRIELIKENNKYKPIFKFDTQIYLYDNRANDTYCINQIKANEYSILISLENSTGEIKDEISYQLDKQFLNQLNSTMCPLTGNCYLQANKEEETYNYSFIIPITEEYIQTSLEEGEFFTYIYTIRNKEPFKDLKIARNGGRPNFKPGDTSFLQNQNLNFYKNKKQDHAKILLFNPSFYHTNFNLSISSLTDNNFDIDIDAQDPQKITLYPFEQREIFIKVNATHNPWPTDPSTKNLVIELKTTLIRSDEENNLINEEKKEDHNIILNIHPDDIDFYFDIIPKEINPKTIITYNPNRLKSQTINLSWIINGAENTLKDYNEKTYYINYTLYEGSFDNGRIVKTQEISKTIDKTKKQDYLTFDYSFNSSFDYELVLTVNSKNNLIESDISNNIKHFNLPTELENCYYNQSDNSQYYYDFFGNLIKDQQCTIGGTKPYYNCCPYPNRCSASLNGLCLNTLSTDCSNYNQNDCDDSDKTNPLVCTFQEKKDNGKCIGCKDSLAETCGSYDNEASCIIDNCEFAGVDANNVGDTQKGKCIWSTRIDFEESCNYQSTQSTCEFDITINDQCKTGGNYIINYTSQSADCTNYKATLPCPGQITIPFFGILQFLLVFILIFIFHLLKILK